jgi:hypothetical protein
VAKSRSRSRKTASPKKSARKTAGKKTAATVKRERRTVIPVREKPAYVELSGLRTDLRSKINILNSVSPNEKIRDAMARLERCLAEIHEICGPNMTVPLP